MAAHRYRPLNHNAAMQPGLQSVVDVTIHIHIAPPCRVASTYVWSLPRSSSSHGRVASRARCPVRHAEEGDARASARAAEIPTTWGGRIEGWRWQVVLGLYCGRQPGSLYVFRSTRPHPVHVLYLRRAHSSMLAYTYAPYLCARPLVEHRTRTDVELSCAQAGGGGSAADPHPRTTVTRGYRRPVRAGPLGMGTPRTREAQKRGEYGTLVQQGVRGLACIPRRCLGRPCEHGRRGVSRTFVRGERCKLRVPA